MGKNKRKHPSIEETLGRPWCYYCERDFDDLKILISHQKAKHYKCDRCGRRLNTAGGLSVHMNQVHKESLSVIENALPNRSGLEVEIFGMEGIPEEIVQSHNQRVLQQFAQAEADRRAANGNVGADGAGGAAKKPKFEAPSDLKKRLAEHKARKAAEEAEGPGNGNQTPVQGDDIQSPDAYNAPGPQIFHQHPNAPGGHPAPPPNNGQYPYQQPYAGGPPPGPQYQPPPHQQPPYLHQPQPGYGPTGMPPYPSPQGYGPPQQFQPSPGPAYASPYQNGPPPFAGGPPQYPPFHGNGPPPYQGPPHPYGGLGSPPPFQQQQHFQPPPNGTPPLHNNGAISRPPNLPVAPGLPQRPSFAAPPIKAHEMQQMHQGQFKQNPPEHAFNTQYQQMSINGGSSKPASPSEAQPSANATSIDELVSGAAKDADRAAAATKEKASEKASEKKSAETSEEKRKDKKDKSMKLVYSDNETSPEEKMAQLPRYAFTRPT